MSILQRLTAPVQTLARAIVDHERAWLDSLSRSATPVCTASAAFWGGFSLAIDMIEADAPRGYTAAERAAFAAGQVAGFREVDLDRLEWCEAYDRQTEELRDRYGDDEARGTIVGHHADAEGGF